MTLPIHASFANLQPGFTFDKTVWCEVYLDTPLGRTRKPVSKADAFTIAGLNVMTKERGASLGGHFARHFGIISHYDVLTTPQVVVLGKKTPPDSCEPFVWSGTIAEYASVWEVD